MRREPRGRGLARLDPRRGLALIERSRLVPAPRDLRAHQQHERGDEHRRALAREVDQPERDEEREERQHEDQVARLGRRRLAEPREDERGRGHQHDAGRQERRVAIPEPQGTCADDRDHEHGDHHRREPGGEVAGDPVQVLEHRARPVELLPAGADTDVEPPGEDVVAVPEGRPENGDDGDRDDRRPRARAREYIHDLRGEDERSVRMRRDRRQDRDAPRAPSVAGRPLATAARKATYESALVSRKRLYIRP